MMDKKKKKRKKRVKDNVKTLTDALLDMAIPKRTYDLFLEMAFLDMIDGIHVVYGFGGHNIKSIKILFKNWDTNTFGNE